MVLSLPATERSQGYVLRIYGNGEVFVEDVYKYLNDLEYAYNCAYVLDSITQQAEALFEQYKGEPPPIPIRNILWGNWWPPNPEKAAGLVPDAERLKLRGVQLNSPGFWEFIGQLNPLETLRKYLNDRHKRRQDREYREPEEARKLELKNKLLEIQVFDKELELLQRMGATPQDLAILKDKLLKRPLQALNPYQDQQLIVEAEIVDPDLEKKERVTLEVKSFEVITVNRSGEIIKREPKQIIKREPKQAFYFVENLGNGVTLDMVYIPGGTFLMGSPEGEGHDAERPQHEVTVPPFFMGKYPIAQAQWKAVANLPRVNRDLNVDPSHFKGDNQPVEQISWDDAVEFCKRLSKATGKEYRLPSEAEWEYACRAGTTTPFYFGETLMDELANYDTRETYADESPVEYRGETTPVGQFPPNAFGLYDMHGNVCEWCADTWHDNYEGAPIDGSAWMKRSNDRSSLRGGSWLDIPDYCRCAYRNYYGGFNRHRHIGFRVVCASGRTP